MKRLLPIILFSAWGLMASAQTDVAWVPRESEAVMLQAFSWGSMSSTTYGRTKWIDLTTDTVALRDNFDLIWFPPSGYGGGGGSNAGYYPQKWYSQDSDWGTAQKLKALIKALHRGGTQVIADIVVNHHATSGGWGTFYKESFGTAYGGSYQLTKADICAGDEAFTNTSSDCYGSTTHGAADTGDNDSGCRDLDHTSANVQAAVKAYVRWMRGYMGYDGFRYDMVKGYSGSYVDMYNQEAQPTFSVAENFDGDLNYIRSYLSSTNYSTLVFDFPAKFAVFNNAIASSNYGPLKQDRDNKLHRDTLLSRYAVTFVDNHDTFNRGEGNEFNNSTSNGASVTNSTKVKKVLEANAYMLAMPGIPCVFYPHWNACKTQINEMIAARKMAGVHSESRIVSEQTGGSYRYEAVVQGHNSKLMVRIGKSRDTDCPEGYVQMAHGDLYDMYVEQAITALPEAAAATAEKARKVMENGRVVIVRDGKRYSATAALIDN